MTANGGDVSRLSLIDRLYDHVYAKNLGFEREPETAFDRGEKADALFELIVGIHRSARDAPVELGVALRADAFSLGASHVPFRARTTRALQIAVQTSRDF